MKITSDEKDFVIDKVQKMNISFDDGCKIELIEIDFIDLDLDTMDTSFINFTTVFANKELVNHFGKGSKVTHIHFETSCVSIKDGVGEISDDYVSYDIKCYMNIKNLKINTNDHGAMRIKLEGILK